MTLVDLAAILGLAAMAVVYVVFRLGERGGCPNCGGPGGSCGERSAGGCDRTRAAESAPAEGEREARETDEGPLRAEGRHR